MAYRNGNRDQMVLLPPCIEEYVSPEGPVRAYDAFVEALDLKELDIIYDPYKVGNSEYNPQAMLKLFVYGYSYGWMSSRRLERATHHNLSFIEQQGINSKTINLTDPDSALMKSVQGSHTSYNGQSVVNDKNGLIVHADVVGDTSDINQFAQQITQAEAVLEKQCQVAVADAGYADTEELEKVDQQGTKAYL